jgi:hypothetical protein
MCSYKFLTKTLLQVTMFLDPFHVDVSIKVHHLNLVKTNLVTPI